MYFFKHIIVAAIICLTICFFSCSNKPGGLIKQDKMKQVLLHLMMVDEYVNYYLTDDSLNTRDSIRAQMYLDVLNLHHTDSVSFSESLSYYKQNVKEFRELIDSVNTLATREREMRMEAITKATNDSLMKAAKIDSLKNAAITDSLKKAARIDSIKMAERTDSLKNAKRVDSLKNAAKPKKMKLPPKPKK